MTKLENARLRFLAALEALEQSAAEKAAGAPDVSAMREELKQMRDERDRLLSRIAVLEEESRVLAGLTEEVEGRLDDAIADIRQVLAHH